ncbi:MAG: TerB family tellurite resistance protein [Rubrivivax sp.]|nr:TerB family tellurite resistance protein [Rubrivivax sp.]
MLKTLKDLFDSLMPAAPGSPPQAEEHTLQLATAVMLVEVMRADTSFHAGEREAVHAALRSKFMLGADEAQRLAELAEAAASRATDLFAFTSRINERFDMPQKLRMIELMWGVAYADGHLSEHERHVMWRVADLLHVPQGAYVHARLRAQQAAQAAQDAGSAGAG